MAATNWTSTMWRKTLSRPYQPPWSMYWRSSSMGGCAPKVSLAGMFRSSTKTTHLRPMGGPYTPFLRLSSRPSTCSCVMLPLVRADRVMKTGDQRSPGRPCTRWRLMYTLLPVPVGPTISSGKLFCSATSSRKV